MCVCVCICARVHVTECVHVHACTCVRIKGHNGLCIMKVHARSHIIIIMFVEIGMKVHCRVERGRFEVYIHV